MKFVQQPPSESKGSQGVPSIPTLTIVSTPESAPAAPAAPATPAASVPPAVPAPAPVLPMQTIEITPLTAKTPEPSVSWQTLIEQQTRALEMDLKKNLVVTLQQQKLQLQTIVQNQEPILDAQRIQFEKTVEAVKQEWQTELQNLEKNFETQRAQWSGEMEAKQGVIESLQKEIGETKKQLEQIMTEKKSAPAPVPMPEPLAAAPVPVSAPAPTPAPVTEAPARIITPTVLPPLEMMHAQRPPRVAFLKKLWNYLNQPAIELPLPNRHQD